MRGFMYHNFILTKASLRAIAFLQALLVFCWILLVCLSRQEAGNLDIETMISNAVIGVLILLSSFLFLEFVSGDIFKQAEGASWCNFAIATPGSIRDYIAAKYEFVFMIDLLTLFMWILVDAIVVVINSEFILLQEIALIIFGFQLLLHALELLCSTRFGSTMGGYVKYGFLGMLFFGVIFYGLYGDLSFFKQENPVEVLTKMIEESKVIIWIIELLPAVAIAVYLFSCKIAIKLYRKGVANYEQ